MVAKIPKGHPLRVLFAGLVEQVFMAELGICDVRLTDYLGELLADFVHMDAIYRFRTVDGEVIRDVSRAELEAHLGPDVSGKARARIIHRHIGDFTLFWAGVYPESLSARRCGVSRLHEYLLQGRRSYGIASELSDEHQDPPGGLLRQLSEEIECCAHGLHLVRMGWEQLNSKYHMS